MANTLHGSGTPTALLVRSDGKTLDNLQCDPTLHAIEVSDAATGADSGPAQSLHDENHVPILYALSSADGKTPVALYLNSSSQLLIKST